MPSPSSSGPSDHPAPWREDPRLKGRFHPEAPDDVQVYIHDGNPRFCRRIPEVAWVRVLASGRAAFRGQILTAPQGLLSVKQSSTIIFQVCKNTGLPFLVSKRYLEERREWHVKPCTHCGFSGLFEPPSELFEKAHRGAPEGMIPMASTAFCPLCGGVQMIYHKDIDEDLL